MDIMELRAIGEPLGDAKRALRPFGIAPARRGAVIQ